MKGNAGALGVYSWVWGDTLHCWYVDQWAGISSERRPRTMPSPPLTLLYSCHNHTPRISKAALSLLLCLPMLGGLTHPAGAQRLFDTGLIPFDDGGGRSVALGDLNGDGKPDLAVANSSCLSVLLGNGDATFRARADYAAGGAGSFIAVGDLNSDGKLDVVGANGNPTTGSVLLGIGNGPFA